MLAAAAPTYPEGMTPDSSEGRERLTRLEERVSSNYRQIEALGPLVKDVARIQWNLDEVMSDLRELRSDMRTARVEEKKERGDEIHDLRRSLSDQILVIADGLKGCSTKIGEVADEQRAWQKAERERRDNEARAILDERTQDTISKRTLYGVLGAAALAALAAILAPIISAIIGG